MGRAHGFIVATAAALLGASALVPAGLGGLASAAGSIVRSGPAQGSTGPRAGASDLASDLTSVDRSTVWTQLSKLKLDFPTYHPEGLVVTGDRFYLSSTQIIEPTVKYPTPVGGFDRTPGKGIGHLFVIGRDGTLIKDVILGQDIVYHPGGIDLSGHDLWVPVAQYRPNSSAEIDHVDLRTLRVTRLFTVADHD
jgi:hypothetical protein